MPPTVILIRHAQALHNYSIPDPPLSSPLGFEKQCTELQEALKTDPIAQKAELIVISPMRRTLQTAQQGLGFLIDRGVPVILRAEWQENSDKPCDIGSPIPIISREFPDFDWSAVDPVWPSKTGLYRFSREGLMERGTMAKEWLRSIPEKVIVIVSHSGFLRVGVSHKGYYNADYRIFEFGEGEKEGDLVELDVTEKNGGGLGKSNYGTYYLGPGVSWSGGSLAV
ncbi:hypothetical protein HYALB_00006886 [Hymenoscyphus albidus]|uniref:Phosphoglycerate mutase-like protein n=1 Tax=Hymenoscyphus albidus TaxID=595503 RepID=A0A9N9M4D8_9HELO|nr:hypothetical protein HYALB_00006886 [Hymenoscyphus albidus]